MPAKNNGGKKSQSQGKRQRIRRKRTGRAVNARPVGRRMYRGVRIIGRKTRSRGSATKLGSTHVESGEIFLSQLYLNGTNYASAIPTVYREVLNPGNFIGTRLATLARAYERYKYLQAELVYRPTCAKTLGGQIVMYFDTNINDFPPADHTAATRQACDASGNRKVNVNASAKATLPTAGSLPSYYTANRNLTGSFTDQAAVTVVQSVALSDFNGQAVNTDSGPTAVGTLHLQYKVLFSVPESSSSESTDPSAFRGSSLLTIAMNSSTAAASSVSAVVGSQYTGTFDGYPVASYAVNSTRADGVYHLTDGTGTLTGVTTAFNYLSGANSSVRLWVVKTVSLTKYLMVMKAAASAPSVIYNLGASDMPDSLYRITDASTESTILALFEPVATTMKQADLLQELGVMPTSTEMELLRSMMQEFRIRRYARQNAIDLSEVPEDEEEFDTVC